MKLRVLGIMLFLLLLLIPLRFLIRCLKENIRPRESAARFFLYILANFILVLVYTILLVGVVVRIFPVKPPGII